MALGMFSAMSFATVNITVTPNVIDFGTVVLDQNGEAQPEDFMTATLSWTGMQDYCGVWVDTISAPNSSLIEFSVVSDSGSDYWYAGDPWTDPETTVYVSFYAVAAGDYTAQYSFYSYEDEDWEVKSAGTPFTVKVKVVNATTALDETATPVEVRKELRNGRLVILRNGTAYSVEGVRE